MIESYYFYRLLKKHSGINHMQLINKCNRVKSIKNCVQQQNNEYLYAIDQDVPLQFFHLIIASKAQNFLSARINLHSLHFHRNIYTFFCKS